MSAITVWGDIRCPWCWMGRRRLAAALERVEREVTVVHRSFLLEPEGPQSRDRTVRTAALNSWGVSAERWEATRLRVADAGRADGLAIDMDGVLSIDSRPAHRLVKLAVARGITPDRAWDRAFSGHLERHEDLADPATLRGIGTELGLDGSEVDSLLGSDRYADEVEDDHRAAVALGVGAVPAFLYEERLLSGARSVDELVDLLNGAEAVR
ncbi:DsbA family oxidoreductase [Nocardiopsis prasina]|uniref:DsbA family oxidoreductase n=1 Tax=Nocardiopsis prasina TaxID=2015 RepID=UPI00036E70A1|nr:DsbA family oxidoreductase [Nocardiopsis prasina]